MPPQLTRDIAASGGYHPLAAAHQDLHYCCSGLAVWEIEVEEVWCAFQRFWKMVVGVLEDMVWETVDLGGGEWEDVVWVSGFCLLYYWSCCVPQCD